MRTEILQTKLYIPPSKPFLSPRPHLVQRLNDALARKLVVVSAPAGFGKTTLIAEWGEQIASLTDSRLQNRTPQLCWLSLDQRDNDPVRFWTYFIAALQQIQPALGSRALAILEESPQAAPVEALLTSLINEIVAETAVFALVLDDYHLIESHAVHNAVSFLIEHLPPPAGMTLIFATRADPPLPLSRWRVREDLTELRAADLAFSAGETAVYLRHTMGLQLSTQEAAALATRTEGWIAGIQMAALSLQRREDVAEFIRNFSGSHRFIFDYLIEEVLAQQSSHTQSFLLKTSILERMTAELCDAVTGRKDSRHVLAELEQANLFIVPLDDERQWYRYHHLFADLLRQRLNQSCPEKIPELHRLACAWYRHEGLLRAAVSHGLQGGDFEQTADLIESLIFEAMAQRELVMLERWLKSLPPELVRRRPWLCVAFAWILTQNKEYSLVAPHLQHAESASGNMEQAERQHIGSYIASIRAECRIVAGDIDGAIHHAREALRLVPEKDKKLQMVIASLLGTSLQRQGEFEEAAQAFMEGIVAGQALGKLNAAINIYGDLIGLYVERGQLHHAYAICQEALNLVAESFRQNGRYPVGAAHIHFRLSTILRHWNNLEESLKHAKQSNEILEDWGLQRRLSWINLAIALQAVGDNTGAAQAIQQAEIIAAGESAFWVEDVRSTQALLWLAQGNVKAAANWAAASGFDVEDEISYQYQLIYRTLAQIYLAQGQNGVGGALDKALRLASRLLALVEASGAVAYLIQLLILQALALQAKGEIESAFSPLERALALGKPGGYVRVFVREGDPMRTLLQRAAARGLERDYVSKLLAEFAARAPGDSVTIVPRSALIEPLSQRELETLQLLATGLSNKGIAQEMVIAVGTVKKHLKNIYQKLNVHSRTEAVARARESGILLDQ